MRKSPCCDCSGRLAGCHAVCEAYGEYAAENAQSRERRREMKASESGMRSFFRDSMERKRRRRGM